LLIGNSNPKRLSGITHSFPWLFRSQGHVTYALLPRSPLSPLRVLARLACLIHAANVHSEPGSNPSWCMPPATTKSTPQRKSRSGRNGCGNQQTKALMHRRQPRPICYDQPESPPTVASKNSNDLSDSPTRLSKNKTNASVLLISEDNAFASKEVS
jgi:hypothetical protein